MSSLTLTVVTVDALAPQVPMAATFGSEGGTLGRDESSTLALPDKHRRVSRLHGTIRFNGSVAVLTNASTSLPIMVGDRQLDYGDTQELGDGMYVELGPYVLVAHYNTAAAREARAAQLAPRVPENPLAARPAAAATGAGPGGMPTSAPVTAPAVAPAPILPEAALGTGDPFDALLAGLGSASPMAPVPSAWPGGQAGAPLAGSPVPMTADPLAAFGIPGPTPAISPPPSAVSLPPVSRAFQTPAAPIIPEDFNPFDLPSEAPRNAFDPLAELAPPPSPAQMALDGGETPPVESLFPPAAPTLRDPLLDAFGSPSSAAAPIPLADGTLESLVRASGPTDPLALLTGAAESQPEAPVADRTPEYRAAFQPPQALDPVLGPALDPLAALTGTNPVPIPGDPFADLLGTPGGGTSPGLSVAAPSPVPAMPAAAIPSSAQPPAAANTAAAAPLAAVPPVNADALTRAFMEGAELAPAALPNGLTPEHMRIIGGLLRAAIGGAIDMLAARATTKRELQASVTIISVEANNPLKFLPNADAALQQLLGKKMPGFMRADVAMRDAFDDLRAHEVGVIAGTRAALEEVLGKFDPARLEQRLAKGSVLESVLPAARKSKLWDQYVALFSQVRREAEDDFQSVFGRAFVDAYEKETQRMKGRGPG